MVQEHLLTPYGPRSLAPGSPGHDSQAWSVAERLRVYAVTVQPASAGAKISADLVTV